MKLIQNYLFSPKTKKVLETKLGEEGFSLIELVVVVAVLAILAAISIPAFNEIVERAAVTVAMTHLINATQECQVAIASGDSNPSYRIPENTSRFQYPDSGTNGMCRSPNTGNILTAARIEPGKGSSTYNLNINVITGEKSTERAVPSYVSWQ